MKIIVNSQFQDELDYCGNHMTVKPYNLEDIATAEDLAAHDTAMKEYSAGETVPHDAIDWDC